MFYYFLNTLSNDERQEYLAIPANALPNELHGNLKCEPQLAVHFLKIS